MTRATYVLLCSLLLTGAAQAQLTPPVAVDSGQALTWGDLADGVEAGSLTLAEEERGRLVAEALRAMEAGNHEADRFLSAAVAQQLEPLRRADGTLDWAAGLREFPRLNDGTLHASLPLFLEEATRAVHTGDPSRLDELAEAFSQTDLLAQLGVVTVGISTAHAGLEAIGAVARQRMRVGIERRLLRSSLGIAMGLSLFAIAHHSPLTKQELVLPLAAATTASMFVKGGSALVTASRPGSAVRNLLRKTRWARRATITLAVGEVVVTLLLADAIDDSLHDQATRNWAARKLEEAAHTLTELSLRYRLGEVSDEELESALSEYQSTWAGYRNMLYARMVNADRVMTRALDEIQRDASKLRVEREQALRALSSFPALLARRLQAAGLSPDTSLEDYRAHLLARDATGLVERWERAAKDYQRARDHFLEEVYHGNLRTDSFLREAEAGTQSANVAVFRDAHTRLSPNRLQTYLDERDALTFAFAHLFPGVPAELRERVHAVTARQRELDTRLFASVLSAGETEPAGPDQEGLTDRVAAQD